MVAAFFRPFHGVFASGSGNAPGRSADVLRLPGTSKNSTLGTTVMTVNGKLRGGTDEYGTWVWKGIPFAKPPVGDLRWKAPQPPESWNGVRSANRFGSRCSQYNGSGEFTGSEDCLYLNVWRPATREHNLPVYVWIHGGGNSTGSADEPWLIGDRLSSRANMVVVTTQYRLGPMGWFAHESLRNGDPLDDSGNYGNLDNIMALRWVKVNIAAFGGNPGNVTVAGQSSGGYNVCSLIISPLAKGLFHKAVSQSGGFNTVSLSAGAAGAQAAIDKILARDGLDVLPANGAAYLRGKSASEILGAYPVLSDGMLPSFVGAFNDGAVVRSEGVTALKDPTKFQRVPMILGSNKEEYKELRRSSYTPETEKAYQGRTLYESESWRTNGVDEPAALMSRFQPVYAYQFDYGGYRETGFNAWPTAAPADVGGRTRTANYAVMVGASHSLEIAFFFGKWEYTFRPDLIFREDNKSGREALSEDMVAYLKSFVRTGSPGSVHGVLWEPWSNDKGGPKRIIFDADATKARIRMSDIIGHGSQEP
jgi:para-nitrobenzyl esterase